MNPTGDFSFVVLDFDAAVALGEQPGSAVGEEGDFAIGCTHVAHATRKVDEAAVLGVVAGILVVSQLDEEQSVEGVEVEVADAVAEQESAIAHFLMLEHLESVAVVAHQSVVGAHP